MIIGYETKLKNMENIKPIGVSAVSGLKRYIPKNSFRLEPDPIDNFWAFSVDVTYAGDLARSGHIYRKFVFNPKNVVGRTEYVKKDETTKITFLFQVENPFFTQDAYLAANQFCSMMSVRAYGNKQK